MWLTSTIDELEEKKKEKTMKYSPWQHNKKLTTCEMEHSLSFSHLLFQRNPLVIGGIPSLGGTSSFLHLGPYFYNPFVSYNNGGIGGERAAGLEALGDEAVEHADV